MRAAVRKMGQFMPVSPASQPFKRLSGLMRNASSGWRSTL